MCGREQVGDGEIACLAATVAPLVCLTAVLGPLAYPAAALGGPLAWLT